MVNGRYFCPQKPGGRRLSFLPLKIFYPRPKKICGLQWTRGPLNQFQLKLDIISPGMEGKPAIYLGVSVMMLISRLRIMASIFIFPVLLPALLGECFQAEAQPG